MNFLAHLYLSGDSDEIKVGNFIADHVKGKRYLSYPEDIQTGILLHRQIDSFTDNIRELLSTCISTIFWPACGITTPTNS